MAPGRRRSSARYPGVGHVIRISGMSFLLGANGSNLGTMFVMLEPFDERHDARADAPTPSPTTLRDRLDKEIEDGHGGRLRRAAGRRPGQRRRLQDHGRGPRRRRAWKRSRQQTDNLVQQGNQTPGPGRPVHRVPRQHAAALRRHRPHQVQDDGRAAERRLRHAAGLPGRALRQRLQPVRPHLAGQRPGRRALPHAARGRAAAEGPQRQRRDGAAGHRGRRSRTTAGRSSSSATTCIRPPRSTATSLPGVSSGEAIAHDGGTRPAAAARGDGLRVDRADVPADHGRQHGRCSSSPVPWCWCSSCWPRSTKAGRCRWP